MYSILGYVRHSDAQGNFKFREPTILIGGEPTSEYFKQESKALQEYFEDLRAKEALENVHKIQPDQKWGESTTDYKVRKLEERVAELEKLIIK